MVNSKPIASSSPIATFFNQLDAEAAKAALQEAGFTEEQIILQSAAPEPNQPVRATQASRSAGGGAIIGTLFGGLAGLLIGAVTSNLPAGSVSVQISPIAMALAGSAIGAFGFALMGVASGLNVPKTQTVPDPESYKYQLSIASNETNDEAGSTDAQRAAEVLRQKGIEA